MKKRIWTAGIIPMMLLGSMMITSCQKEMDKVSPVGTSANGSDPKAHNIPTRTFVADLSGLNDSGVEGTATISITANELTVHIMASGLEPNMLHPQHIHGFTTNNGNATCPTMADDTNGNGLVELGEGLPSYGPVLLDLQPFPTADASGNIDFTMTYALGEGDMISRKDLMPLQNRAIVLHGMTVDGEYWATLPVACGQLSPMPMGQGNNN